MGEERTFVRFTTTWTYWMPHEQMRFDTTNNASQFYSVEVGEFPETRYQGSKRKIGDWLWNRMQTVEFDSLLDAFGGTGYVSHRAKQHGIRVVYNDYLPYNHQIGTAIIENGAVELGEEVLDFLHTRHDELEYSSLVEEEFDGIYFTEPENRWLDTVRRNVQELDNQYERALILSAVGQAALAKRPYALFHRANLDLRLEENVERSFGNKATWDRSFDEHFREKIGEFNDAVFDNGRDNEAYCRDVLEWENPPETDAVYIDPPYYDREKDGGSTDYQFYYHFLNGYVNYDEWRDRIDSSVQTKRLDTEPSPWLDKEGVYTAFRTTIELFADRDIIISYNSAGLPTPEEIREMLSEYKSEVTVTGRTHQYVLSPDEKEELVFIATD